jgi:hypothetical protein
MSLQKQIDALRTETGMARPDQLLDVCEGLLELIQEQGRQVSAILQAQGHFDARLNKLEAARLYVEPRG